MTLTGVPVISCIAGAAIAVGGVGLHHVAERDRGISRTQTNKRKYSQQPTM